MEVVLTGRLEALPQQLVLDLTKAVKQIIETKLFFSFLVASRNEYQAHKEQLTINSTDTWPKIVQLIIDSAIQHLVLAGHRLASTHKGSLRNIGLQIAGLCAEELEFCDDVRAPTDISKFYRTNDPTCVRMLA